MGDLIDTVLKIGATFDWISPTLSVVQDVLNGPSHTFLITRAGCPLSGREINLMLSRRGIASWGYMVVDDTLMVSVCEADARQAEAALRNHKVPIQNPQASPAKAGKSRKAAPRAQVETAHAEARWYQCEHCRRWYRQWKSRCPSCGAPLQPG